jgi:hypothetical protein
MERGGPRRSGQGVALTALLLIALTLAASLPADAALTKFTVNSITWSPNKPQPGDVTTFTITITNTYSSDASVKWFGMHFDWMAPNDFVFEDHSSSPIKVHSGGTYSFILVVTVPSNATYTAHSYYIKMNYVVGTFSYSETSDNYNDLFLTKFVEHPPAPFWEDPLILLTLVLVVVMVLVIMVLLVVRQRRIDREKTKTRSEFKTEVSSSETVEDVELAKTVTKHHEPTGSVRVDHRPKHWEAPQEQRFVGQPPKPPIYKILGSDKDQQPGSQQPQQMPQTPPPPLPHSTDQSVQQMPARPPTRMTPQTSPPPTMQGGLPPPLPPAKEQATLHQCPICGKMNKATDSVCPKCGNAF